MTLNIKPPTAMVLGLGNVLLGDEGFGIHVIRRLKETDLPSCIHVEDGGVGGFNLLGLLEGIKHLLVIDVMMLSLSPGILKLIPPDSPPAEPGKRILSFHQVGILELLQLSGLISHRPETSFLVTRPHIMDWSTELSPALEASVDKAVELVRKWCSQISCREGEINYV